MICDDPNVNDLPPVARGFVLLLACWWCLAVCCCAVVALVLIPFVAASRLVIWCLSGRSGLRARLCLGALLMMATAAEAAKKPEPLTYKSGGRRYVITLPDSQLWSQSEVARAVQWHKAGELSIGGQAIRQARVRGVAGDRTNRLYLVVVIKTGKRLSPEARYMVRPDPWPSVPVAAPMPPQATKTLSSAKSGANAAQPLTVTLTWADVPGAVPAGWGATALVMMPDGGPKFWTVSASRDLRAWRTVAVTETPSAVIGSVWPAEYYRVHWRGEGAPAEVWP